MRTSEEVASEAPLNFQEVPPKAAVLILSTLTVKQKASLFSQFQIIFSRCLAQVLPTCCWYVLWVGGVSEKGFGELSYGIFPLS